jgi:hypothetical protein
MKKFISLLQYVFWDKTRIYIERIIQEKENDEYTTQFTIRNESVKKGNERPLFGSERPLYVEDKWLENKNELRYINFEFRALQERKQSGYNTIFQNCTYDFIEDANWCLGIIFLNI